MKRTIVLPAVALAAACAASGASAHADIGVFLGIPGPVFAPAPAVVYAPPPPVYAPPPVYGYPAGYVEWNHERYKHWRKAWKERYEDDDDD